MAAQKVGLNILKSSEKYHVACHGDEPFLMFKIHELPLEGVWTQNDKVTSKKILALLTNFAKYGDPTSDPDGKLPQIDSGVQWERYWHILIIIYRNQQYNILQPK